MALYEVDFGMLLKRMTMMNTLHTPNPIESYRYEYSTNGVYVSIEIGFVVGL